MREAASFHKDKQDARKSNSIWYVKLVYKNTPPRILVYYSDTRGFE